MIYNDTMKTPGIHFFNKRFIGGNKSWTCRYNEDATSDKRFFVRRNNPWIPSSCSKTYSGPRLEGERRQGFRFIPSTRDSLSNWKEQSLDPSSMDTFTRTGHYRYDVCQFACRKRRRLVAYKLLLQISSLRDNAVPYSLIPGKKNRGCLLVLLLSHRASISLLALPIILLTSLIVY